MRVITIYIRILKENVLQTFAFLIVWVYDEHKEKTDEPKDENRIWEDAA